MKKFLDEINYPSDLRKLSKDKLKQVSEVNLGVREIMSLYRSEIQWVKVDSSVATLDLNTPEVYQKAKSIFVELLDN